MSFCTVVNCMDGRVQDSVAGFAKERFGVEWADTVTGAGINKTFADGDQEADIAAFVSRVRISVEKHGSSGIVVAGHDGCAGNPTPEAQQAEDTRAAVALLQGIFPDVPILGVWATLDGTVTEVQPA